MSTFSPWATRGGSIALAIALCAGFAIQFDDELEHAAQRRSSDGGPRQGSRARVASEPGPAHAPRAIARSVDGHADAGSGTLETERAQAREAGRGSDFLIELPAEDQEWVIDEGAAALARGQVDLAELPAYVDQLASVRTFDVLERTAQYVSPEAFR